MKVIQRTPDLGLRIRLQPLQRPAAEPEGVPAAAQTGALQVVWSAVITDGPPPRRGTDPFDWEAPLARLHEWHSGDAPITPIAAARGYYVGLWLVATVHGTAPDAEIIWSIDAGEDDWAVEPLEDPDTWDTILSGVSCVIKMIDPMDEEPTTRTVTLSATVDGVSAGSVVVHWSGAMPA